MFMYIFHDIFLHMLIYLIINIINTKLDRYQQSDIAPDEWTAVHYSNLNQLNELKIIIDERGDSLNFTKKDIFYKYHKKFTDYNVSNIVGDFSKSDPRDLNNIIEELVNCIDELINTFVDYESEIRCYNLRSTLGQEAEKMKQSFILQSMNNQLVFHRNY